LLLPEVRGPLVRSIWKSRPVGQLVSAHLTDAERQEGVHHTIVAVNGPKRVLDHKVRSVGCGIEGVAVHSVKDVDGHGNDDESAHNLRVGEDMVALDGRNIILVLVLGDRRVSGDRGGTDRRCTGATARGRAGNCDLARKGNGVRIL